MPRLSKKEVLRIAKLASISLSSEQAERFRVQLEKVIDYVRQLDEVNTEGVEPTSQTTGIVNNLRQDVSDPSECLSQEEALSEAKNTHNGYFVVERIIE